MKKIGWFRHEELLALGVFGPKSRLGDRIEMLLTRGRTFSSRASLGRVATSAAVLLIVFIAASFAPRWIAFAQQEPRPSFEVATIKPGDPNVRQVFLQIAPGGRFKSSNASLKMLIGFAYDVRNHQISGGPDWLDSAKFNIEAKPDSATSIPAGPQGAPQLRLMLQSLLADRFKLAVHREMKEESVYNLVVAKGGPKLKAATVEPGKRTPRGLRMGRGQLIGTASPLALLVNTLSQQLGRSVIDKTGLTGNYDFTLEFAPEPGQPVGPPDAPGAASPPDSNGPSIFTVLEEQLGLKLESAKGPVELLVIDHAEKPDAN